MTLTHSGTISNFSNLSLTSQATRAREKLLLLLGHIPVTDCLFMGGCATA